MLHEFSPRINFPFMHGLYLGINAVRDAYLLVDGPNCSFFKAEHIHGGHDFNSTLLDNNDALSNTTWESMHFRRNSH